MSFQELVALKGAKLECLPCDGNFFEPLDVVCEHAPFLPINYTSTIIEESHLHKYINRAIVSKMLTRRSSNSDNKLCC